MNHHNAIFKVKYFLVVSLLWLGACTESTNLIESNQNTTISGSYATILTVGQMMYLVNQREIWTYDITAPKDPILRNRQDVGFAIESLYHHQGLLLVGSASAMYIFRLNEQKIPVRQSTTEYFTAGNLGFCQSDPIVARENLAYVTISSIDNTSCPQGIPVNQLRVYNISDLSNPLEFGRTEMAGPKGLGLGKQHLFVADREGLAIFNLENPEKPKLVNILRSFIGTDIIINGNLLILVGQTQLMQFDIEDETNIRYLGAIAL